MSIRRLALAALLSAFLLLVGSIVVGMGAHDRDMATPAPKLDQVDPDSYVELMRIAQALEAEQACAGPVDCTPARAADRLRSAAEGIGDWPLSRRHAAVRQTLTAQLRARAALLDQWAAMEVDGFRSSRELAHAKRLEEHAKWTARAALDAQHQAGLVSRRERIAERRAIGLGEHDAGRSVRARDLTPTGR